MPNTTLIAADFDKFKLRVNRCFLQAAEKLSMQMLVPEKVENILWVSEKLFSYLLIFLSILERGCVGIIRHQTQLQATKHLEHHQISLLKVLTTKSQQ